MKFDLRTDPCKCCGKPMMGRDRGRLFPYGYDITQEAQMKTMGVVFISSSKIDDDYICTECEKFGKASFICALCNTRQNSSEVQMSFGDPSEHLCKTCYSTTSAKVWNEKVEELEESHRWDFE